MRGGVEAEIAVAGNERAGCTNGLLLRRNSGPFERVLQTKFDGSYAIGGRERGRGGVWEQH